MFWHCWLREWTAYRLQCRGGTTSGKPDHTPGSHDQLVQTWCSICSVYKQVYEYCSLFCSLAILGPRDDCITNYSFPFISVSSHSYCLLQCQTGAHFDIIQPRYPLFWCCSLGKVLCHTWRRFPNLITCPKYLSFCFWLLLKDLAFNQLFR